MKVDRRRALPSGPIGNFSVALPSCWARRGAILMMAIVAVFIATSDQARAEPASEESAGEKDFRESTIPGRPL